MSISFVAQGKEVSFEFLSDLDPKVTELVCVSEGEIEYFFEESDFNAEWAYQLSFQESIYEMLAICIDEYLESKIDPEAYLGWDRWNIVFPFRIQLVDEEGYGIEFDLDSLETDDIEVYIPIKDQIWIKFTYYYANPGNISGRSQKTIEVLASDLGFDYESLIIFNLDEIKSKILGVPNRRQEDSSRFVLDALKSMPPNSFRSFFNDIGLIRLSRCISKSQNYSIESLEDAERLLSESSIFFCDGEGKKYKID